MLFKRWPPTTKDIYKSEEKSEQSNLIGPFKLYDKRWHAIK